MWEQREKEIFEIWTKETFAYYLSFIIRISRPLHYTPFLIETLELSLLRIQGIPLIKLRREIQIDTEK